MRHRFSATPFLLAFLIGIAFMPLGIYDIHARELGALDVGHRSTRATSSLVAAERPAASGLLTKLRTWTSTVAGDERGLIAAELLAPVAGIKALKQRAADLVAAMKGVQAKLGDTKLAADAPERAELKTEMSTLLSMTEANASDLKDAERLAEFERTLSPIADADADASRRAAQAGRVDVTDRSASDPKRGFKDHREFMASVMDVARTGKVDPRLKPLAAAGSDEAGEYSDPYGNFLIPVAFSPDVLAVQSEGDPTATLTRKMPMTAPSVLVNARVDKNHTSSVSGGLVVYRHGETDAITPSRQKYEQLRFNAEDLVGAAHATENQISDSPGSFIALISDGFKDEFARKILLEKLRGTGTGGQYLGALTSPAKIEVSKETGQAADTIVVENIDKMAARCWGYTSDRTVYLANQTTRPALRGLVRNVGTGGAPVAYFTQDGGVERLDGRPIIFTDVCSAIGDAGDIVLVNWAEFIEGLYQPLQQAESIHVRFLNNERTFKFWVRNCGMPWWSSALTPKNGSTLSPIVSLAAR